MMYVKTFLFLGLLVICGASMSDASWDPTPEYIQEAMVGLAERDMYRSLDEYNNYQSRDNLRLFYQAHTLLIFYINNTPGEY